MPLPRRRVLVLLAGSLLASAATCDVTTRRPADPADLDALVAQLAAGAYPDQDYRPPDEEERAAVPAALDRLLAGDAGAADAAFDRLGMDVAAATDRATGRPFVRAVSRPGAEAAWGAVVVDRGGPPSLLVEVPHLVADRHTEEIGLDLYRAVPGAVLLIAGAHRRAAGDRADVAHQTGSFFHAAATHLGGRGLPELQLHGFDSDSLPDVDAVVSPGASTVGPLTTRTADGLAAAGLKVCRAWGGTDCGSLEGRTNVQGQAAAAAGRQFVHLELAPNARDEQRDAVVAALARAAAPGDT